MNEKSSRSALETRIRQLEIENRRYRNLLSIAGRPVGLPSSDGDPDEELLKSEKRYRLLFEQSNDAIIIHDLDGRILDANSRAFEMLGYDGEDLFQKTIHDIHPDRELETMESAFRETRALGYARFESKLIRVDGGILEVEISSRMVDKSKGLVQGIIRDITKRKRAKEELRRRESLFEKIFDILPIGLWLADRNGHVLRGNPAGIRIWGADPRVSQAEYGTFKARRLPSKKEIAPDDWALVHTINEGITVMDEMLEIDAFDGKKKIILNHSAPVLDDQGRVEGAIIMNQEVTDRVRAEQALRESEKSFRTLAENANDGILIAIEDGRHIFANAAASKILGYSVSELQKTAMEDLVHPDEQEKLLDRFKKRLKGKMVQPNYETSMVGKDGTKIDLNLTASQMSWNGTPAVMVSFRDIRKQKEDEKRLVESEEKLRRILDSLPDMVLEVDRALKINWANKAALDRNRCTIGGTCHDAYAGDAGVCEGCPCARAFETGRIETGVMHQPASQTAGERYWDNLGIPLKSKGGKVDTVLVISRNVTERKLAEKENIRLESRLRQAHKMEAIGTLSGGIAHDFNNILGIILGNAELAMDDVPEWNSATEFLKEIRSATLRAKDVVRELLTFSRKSEEQKKPLDLAPLIKETMKMLRATIPTSIPFELIMGEKLKTVHADPTQISQILLNLVSNAADAMSGEGGFLKVTVKNAQLSRDDLAFDAELTPGEYVKIKVSDTGSGIDLNDFDRIFDPYFTTKEIGKGTGMGLSVVHGIVKRHGGGIRVESERGKGASFEVFLPVIPQAPEVGPKTGGDLPRGRETILFVDDEKAMVKLNRQRLERLGYKVFSETDPSNALRLFKNDPDQFSLIMTDMTMPHITGDRLVKEIHKIRPHMPVILCTGYSDRMSEETAKALGVRKYIEKPIELEALARSVREVLDQY